MRVGEIVGRRAASSWLNQDPSTGVAVVVGRHRLVSDVVDELMDNLATADARIVVCDMSQMAVSPRSMSQVFAPVVRYLAAWPGAVVVACVPDAARRAKMMPVAIPERLLVHQHLDAGVQEARGLTASPLEETRIHLAPVTTAAAGARDFVRRTVEDWQLPDVSWPARLVSSELVTNSMLYGASVLDVRISHVRSRLQIAVHDHGGGAPAVPAGTDAEARSRLGGRGLQLIEAMTRGWGVFPTQPRGKTVWAVLEANTRDHQAPTTRRTGPQVVSRVPRQSLQDAG